MIIVLKKTNLIFVAMIFGLLVILYSLNVERQDNAIPTAGNGQRTVVIDAGHGGEDPGAVSEYNQLKEKEVNLNIATKVKALLESDNYKVIMTREEDKLEYPDETKGIYNKRLADLTRRKKIMDEGGGDIVVSIHLNKFPQTQYFGAQVFYPPNSPDSKRLAETIQNSLKEMVDPNNKRVAMVKDKQPQIIILQNLKTTSVVVECGFLSNQEEERKLGTPEYQEKLALAIKDGIDKYFSNK